jgi:hypothetical protein
MLGLPIAQELSGLTMFAFCAAHKSHLYDLYNPCFSCLSSNQTNIPLIPHHSTTASEVAMRSLQFQPTANTEHEDPWGISASVC